MLEANITPEILNLKHALEMAGYTTELESTTAFCEDDFQHFCTFLTITNYLVNGEIVEFVFHPCSGQMLKSAVDGPLKED